MSDTTITAEEMARMRAIAAKPNHLSHRDGIHASLNKLLDALEQAEARAEKAEKELAGADAEISELRDELEDSRGTEKAAPNILCAIARLVGVYEHCQEIGDDMGTMSIEAVQELLAEKQRAEANVARLTKMVDWLANQLDCPSEFTNCAVDCAECRKEAARRAVAAGEE